MTSQPKAKLSPAEYLALERRAEHKSEYLDGEVFAMTGASRRHNLVCTNIAASLHSQLKRRPYEVYSSDMRVKVSPTGLYTYPDVVVVCGEPRFEDAEVDTLLNPAVIVEVLSESTKNYDRGEKFEHYRALPSLAEYLLVAQDKCHVEHFVRQAGHRWLLAETGDLADFVDLDAIGCRLALQDIYDRVIPLPPEPAAGA